MPFCNKCGAEIGAGATFCAQCGSRNVNEAGAAARPQMSAAPVQPAAQQGLGLGAKIAIGVGVVIVLCIIAIIGLGAYFASHVRTERTANGNVVTLPWGKVSDGQPSDQAARELGVAIYPGATAERSQRVDFGSFHADVLRFLTPDPAAVVLDFYRTQYAKARITNQGGNTLEVVDSGLELNIETRSRGGQTEIVIRQTRH